MTTIKVPDAGDIITLDFDPQAGREITKRRPALVLSPRSFNQALRFAWVCPITSTPGRHQFQLTVPPNIRGFATPAGGVSTVKVEQLRSLDFEARGAIIVAQVPEAFLNQCRSVAARILGY